MATTGRDGSRVPPAKARPEFALADPAVVADPYPFYEMLRQSGSTHWDDTLFGGAWLVLGFDDVEAMLRDWESFSSARVRAIVNQLDPEEASKAEALIDMHARWMIFFDPPRHTELRRIMGRGFSTGVLDRMRGVVAAGADEAASRLEGRERMDLVKELAERIPLLVITSMLDVPQADRDRFLGWTRDIALYMGSERPNEVTIGAAQASLPALQTYFDALADERRSSPRPDDLLSALVTAEPGEGLLSREELFAQASLLLFAGLETTKNLISSAILCLILHPDQAELLARNPERIAGTIEEVLRFESPVQFARRVATRDIQLDGVTIKRGDIVALLIGAANRDPVHFDAPNEFRIDRSPAEGLSFGSGRHTCLGQRLARIEAETAISTLMARVPAIFREPSVTFSWQRSPGFRGLAELEVSIG